MVNHMSQERDSLDTTRKRYGGYSKDSVFMLQRIRACFKVENYNQLGEIVEADESFYGGKNRNRHLNKRVKNSQGRSCKDKTPTCVRIGAEEWEAYSCGG